MLYCAIMLPTFIWCEKLISINILLVDVINDSGLNDMLQLQANLPCVWLTWWSLLCVMQLLLFDKRMVITPGLKWVSVVNCDTGTLTITQVFLPKCSRVYVARRCHNFSGLAVLFLRFQ